MLQKCLAFIALISCCFSITYAINCYFLVRDHRGVYVETYGPCSRDSSYCATRVVTSSGRRAAVLELFEWYCENEHNVTSYLKTRIPPNEGCFSYARDEHLCFCKQDLCNSAANIATIFTRYRSATFRKNVTAEARRPTLNRLNQQRQQQNRIGPQPTATVVVSNLPRPQVPPAQRKGNAASRTVLKVIGDTGRRITWTLQEKSRLRQLQRQKAIADAAEKERRVKEQREHEEALRAYNRHRLELKLAKKERERKKMEEMLNKFKEEDTGDAETATVKPKLAKTNETKPLITNEQKISTDIFNNVTDITSASFNDDTSAKRDRITLMGTNSTAQ